MLSWPPMIEPPTEVPLVPSSTLGLYRASDYWALPDDPRVELVFGRLLLMASPLRRHQVVVMQLLDHLRASMRPVGCEVIVAPMDVILADHSVVQPDLLLVTPERASIVGDRIDGAPDLLIEVLSPSTARLDRGDKLRLYAESNVREYWLVDPEARVIEFLTQHQGRWLTAWPEDGGYSSETIQGLALDLGALWESVAEEMGRR